MWFFVKNPLVASLALVLYVLCDLSLGKGLPWQAVGPRQ